MVDQKLFLSFHQKIVCSQCDQIEVLLGAGGVTGHQEPGKLEQVSSRPPWGLSEQCDGSDKYSQSPDGNRVASQDERGPRTHGVLQLHFTDEDNEARDDLPRCPHHTVRSNTRH